MAQASALLPGHGSLQAGFWASPAGVSAYAQYMQKLKAGPALFARGDYTYGDWSARAGLQWDW